MRIAKQQGSVLNQYATLERSMRAVLTGLVMPGYECASHPASNDQLACEMTFPGRAGCARLLKGRQHVMVIEGRSELLGLLDLS